MNIWHDIRPERITRSSFDAVIEISKGSKMKYELDKETGLLYLFRAPMRSTTTRWMFWCCVRKKSSRWRL